MIRQVLHVIKENFFRTKNYDELINGALSVLAPNGVLLLCTNSSIFSLKAFKSVIKSTLEQANVDYEIKEVMGLPKDFKTHPHYKPSKYLKAVLFKSRIKFSEVGIIPS